MVETHQKKITIEGFPSYKYTRIKTPRLILKAPQKSDREDWVALRERNEEYLKPFEPAWGHEWHTKGMFSKRIARHEDYWKNDAGYGFHLFLRPSAQLIGAVNINHVCRGAAQYAWLGYWIDKDFEGQGLMHEALDATLRFSFSILKLHRMNAATLLNNTRSQHVLEACGFKKEGMAEKYVEINGIRQDHILYGLNKAS